MSLVTNHYSLFFLYILLFFVYLHLDSLCCEYRLSDENQKDIPVSDLYAAFVGQRIGTGIDHYGD